ncbi:MAG: hypothetical protein HYX52_00510 [Chloroflexi bacterium]|nr:hypothetical protein [Chloroflexota bacterium]
MAVSEHTLTEFLQHSGRVLPKTARGEVVLHRREGEDLVLMTRGQSNAVGTLLRVLVEVVDGGADRASTILPWLMFLDEADRDTCLRELYDVARAAVASGLLQNLEDTLYQWEATGLAAWDIRQERERSGGPATLAESVPIPRPSRARR